MATIEALNIAPIDLVVVNLYPFEATVAEGAGYDATRRDDRRRRPGDDPRRRQEPRERDGRGRSRATTGSVLEAMRAHERRTTPQLRRRLAAQGVRPHRRLRRRDRELVRGAERRAPARAPDHHGHARAARRATARTRTSAPRSTSTGEAAPGVATATQVQGKELTFNNLADADAAFELVVRVRPDPAVAIIKHANPCGVARRRTTWREAYAQGAGLRPDQRLRRHRRLQPPARRGRPPSRSPASSPRW